MKQFKRFAIHSSILIVISITIMYLLEGHGNINNQPLSSIIKGAFIIALFTLFGWVPLACLPMYIMAQKMKVKEDAERFMEDTSIIMWYVGTLTFCIVAMLFNYDF